MINQEYRRKCIPGDASPFKEMMKTIFSLLDKDKGKTKQEEI